MGMGIGGRGWELEEKGMGIGGRGWEPEEKEVHRRDWEKGR